MQMTQKVINNHKLAYKDRASLPPASWVSYSLINRLCCCDHLRAATLVLQVVKNLDLLRMFKCFSEHEMLLASGRITAWLLCRTAPQS